MGSEQRGGDEDADLAWNMVRVAIEWFTSDRTTTRQAIDLPDGPTAPGRLLEIARFQAQANDLMNTGDQEQERTLTQAQAHWIIRQMPAGPQPISIDSAQQAGRAWGVLIAADSQVWPDAHVLAAVSALTGLTQRACDEIRYQAQRICGAHARADLLVPYDNAPDQHLIRDWNDLAACGPELSEAATLSQEVLELLTARVSGNEEYDWMDVTAQQTAQVHATICRAQPLLSPVAALIPNSSREDPEAGIRRLRELTEQGHLATATTLATRAAALEEWTGPPRGPNADRTRIVEAAAARVRMLHQLNESLAALDLDPPPSHSALDARSLAELAQAFGELSVSLRTTLTAAKTAGSATQGAPSARQRSNQRPLPPNQLPGGGAPRAKP
ncbi:hypothetical protein ABT160_42840 [Streptomyces sp. NPDC001941]|uniref:hypothetical protein n=1 Tax=Streptomyces sp. NPDC001941 TaxID=3154659 RepID=UPI0033233E00